MTGFQAIVLICLSTTPSDKCNEQTAVSVQSIHVDNELGCTTGWQDIIARSAQSADIGKTTYIRTVCRREGG